MSSIQKFFLFCSGIYSSIIKRAPSDINKYAGIGATVFFTGIFSSIAAGFAVHSVFKSYTIAILFGILWGLMIFNLDRYIVMSMKKKKNIFKELLTATPRLALAVLIAFVISKPLELKLFNSEISAELIAMEQEVFKTQEELLRNRFVGNIKEIKEDISNLDNQLDEKKAHRDQLNELAIQEADGTGGSMKKNLGPIYKAKKKDAELAHQEFEDAANNINPLITSKRLELEELENKMNSELESLERSSLDGFAAQLNALGRLAKNNTTIWWASIFITLLFIAIETAPIFTKLISDRSPYDFRLDSHEYKFQVQHALLTNKLSNHLKEKNRFDTETTKYKTQLSIAAEKEILKELIDKEVGKIKREPIGWSEYLKKRSIFG